MSEQWSAKYFLTSVSTSSGITTLKLTKAPLSEEQPTGYKGRVPDNLRLSVPYSSYDCSLYKSTTTCSRFEVRCVYGT
jgi:hypothetical protein